MIGFGNFKININNKCKLNYFIRIFLIVQINKINKTQK